MLALSFCLACRTPWISPYGVLRSEVSAGQYELAAAYVESVKDSFYDPKSRLLYELDRGMILHHAQHYAASNEALERAKRLAEILWTASLSEEMASLVMSDETLAYPGEDFERVLIHFVESLNYAALGDLAAARVEAIQIGEDLDLVRMRNAGPQTYRDDAFARWLAGRLAETQGDASAYSDAWIDYRRALALYEGDYTKHYATPVPQLVVRSGLRALVALGPAFADERQALAARYPAIAAAAPSGDAAALGHLVFIHLNGEAPLKEDRFEELDLISAKVRVAYPTFVPRPPKIVYASLTTPGGPATPVRTELVEDIAAIAVQDLADHLERLRGQVLARSLTKLALASGMGVFGIFIDPAGDDVTADKRSWGTLPANLTAAELDLPPGTHLLTLQFHDSSGRVLETAQRTVEVRAGATLVLSHRTSQ